MRRCPEGWNRSPKGRRRRLTPRVAVVALFGVCCAFAGGSAHALLARTTGSARWQEALAVMVSEERGEEDRRAALVHLMRVSEQFADQVVTLARNKASPPALRIDAALAIDRVSAALRP